MDKVRLNLRKVRPALTAVVVFLFMAGNCCAASSYDAASGLGRTAALEALNLIKTASGKAIVKADLIVMTDAGYAELGGQPTMGALDGLATITGASRGRNTLIELHAAFTSPLWFAVYDRASGFCAYLETDGFAAGFKTKSVARIDIAWRAATRLPRPAVRSAAGRCAAARRCARSSRR